MRWLDGITDSMDMNLNKLLGDSGGWRSLVCCSPQGHKVLDTTEETLHAQMQDVFCLWQLCPSED